MIPSSADIKHEIIASAAKTEAVRKRIGSLVEAGVSEGDQIEMGNNLESMTKTPGWAIVENFMLTRMNLVGMAVSDGVSEVQRGVSKGYIELMQYIQLLIRQKNVLMEKERAKHEKAENVPEDEKE